MKTAVIHQGRNLWLMEKGATGFDHKTHGPFADEGALRRAAAQRGLRIVEAN